MMNRKMNTAALSAFCMCATAWSAFGAGSVVVDLETDIGPIKPLHGVNNGPWGAATMNIRTDMTRARLLADMGVPFVRLHDTEGRYGGAYFVDISNIFRDFDKDEADPRNYDFAMTDLYIGAVIEYGAEVIYRLGETIDHGVAKRRTSVPRDFGKWARICERVIAHCNEGWADGHRWNIRYWEIWNEPDNPLNPNPQWDGTPEQFQEFYATAAIHLKRRFPGIRIGPGLGTGCPMGTTRWGRLSGARYVKDFLSYVSKRGAPLDFYDMHLYTRDPDEFAGTSAVVKSILGGAGFGNAELIVGEWNNGAESKLVKGMSSAAMCAASFKVMHDAGVEIACYYSATPAQPLYCGLFNYPDGGCAKPYYAFKAYGELGKLGGRRIAVSSPRDDMYALAASNGERIRILISRYTVDRLDWKPNFAYDSDGIPHPSSEPASDAYLRMVEEADRTVAFNLEFKGLPDGVDVEVLRWRLDDDENLAPLPALSIPDGCRSTVMTMRQPEVVLVEAKLVRARLSKKDVEASAGFF